MTPEQISKISEQICEKNIEPIMNAITEIMDTIRGIYEAHLESSPPLVIDYDWLTLASITRDNIVSTVITKFIMEFHRLTLPGVPIPKEEDIPRKDKEFNDIKTKESIKATLKSIKGGGKSKPSKKENLLKLIDAEKEVTHEELFHEELKEIIKDLDKGDEE